MQKTLLITGSTDGIGLETAKLLLAKGHRVLLHGRSAEKLEAVSTTLAPLAGPGRIEIYVADLSRFEDVDALVRSVTDKHDALDVLINNAGVLKAAESVTPDGLDVRFMVNTIAPYRLTRELLPLIGSRGRVVNLSSAAQARVDTEALAGRVRLDAMEAYSQSKLAITMWSRELAKEAGSPMVVAVNPGSLLGSKMVKEGFGVAGGDIGIGADILCRAALDDEFAAASGQYFDNDSGRFADPHGDALDAGKAADVVRAIEKVIATQGHEMNSASPGAFE